MKKSFLLAAFIFVLGSSAMGAKTITTVEKTVVEAQEEARYVYRIMIRDKNTNHSILDGPQGCLTEEEAVSIANLMMIGLGNLDYAYPYIEIMGECDDF